MTLTFLLYFRDYGIVIRSLKDAYFRAEHWSTKRQLLSIVAADLPKRLLKFEFPDLTDWKIKAARAHAFFQGKPTIISALLTPPKHALFCITGRGIILDALRIPIERYTERQLCHFITFIQSPHITTDMPFGERKLKLSNGDQISVPDVIRNTIPSRIVSQYLAYCKETIADNETDFKPLGPSTLFAILRSCAASTRKSLAGLDNFSSDGSNAFDQLRRLCDELATFGEH